MTTPMMMDTIAAAVDYVLGTTPGDIVLGIPLGVGKPNPFVNVLYRRIKAAVEDSGAVERKRLRSLHYLLRLQQRTTLES